jgi:hypothetical protein
MRTTSVIIEIFCEAIEALQGMDNRINPSGIIEREPFGYH